MNRIIVYRFIVIIFIIVETFSIIDGYMNIPDSLFMVGIVGISFLFYNNSFVNKSIISIILYFIVLLANLLLGNELVNLAWVAQEFLFPMVTFTIINTFIQNKDIKGLKIITYVGIAIVFILSIPTVIILNINPNILRDIDHLYNTSINPLSRTGLVRYGVIHSIPFLFPFLVYHFKDKRGLVCKTVILAIILFEYFMIIKASFTIPIILATSTIVIALLISKKVKSNLILIVTSLILLFSFLNKDILISSLESIQPIFENAAVSDKIPDIINSIKYGEGEGQVGIRGELYSKSWNSFVENPLLGTSEVDKAGGHSFFLDRLAYFGLIGSLPLFLFLYYSMKQHYKLIDKERKPYYQISILTFLILGFTKNIAGLEPFLYLFIFIPGLAFSDFSTNLSKPIIKN